METRIKLPVGIESFEEIRKYEYYYVDKTLLIEQVLEEGSRSNYLHVHVGSGKRFGMRYAEKFFEIGTDPVAVRRTAYFREHSTVCAV